MGFGKLRKRIIEKRDKIMLLITLNLLAGHEIGQQFEREVIDLISLFLLWKLHDFKLRCVNIIHVPAFCECIICSTIRSNFEYFF